MEGEFSPELGLHLPAGQPWWHPISLLLPWSAGLGWPYIPSAWKNSRLCLCLSTIIIHTPSLFIVLGHTLYHSLWLFAMHLLPTHPLADIASWSQRPRELSDFPREHPKQPWPINQLYQRRWKWLAIPTLCNLIVLIWFLHSSVVDPLVTQENPLVFGAMPPMHEIEKNKTCGLLPRVVKSLLDTKPLEEAGLSVSAQRSKDIANFTNSLESGRNKGLRNILHLTLWHH